MVNEIRVLLVEDDFYARNWMELLLRRDWRTKVVGYAPSPAQLPVVLSEIKSHHERLDMILVDTDIPGASTWLNEVLNLLAVHSPGTKILFLGVAPNPQVANLIRTTKFAGYLLKDEICYSLAWAVSLAAEHIIITPGVFSLFNQYQTLLSGSLILDGRQRVPGLTDLEFDRSRMVFIFSMERHEFAHEVNVSKDYSYGLVCRFYEKSGLNKVLQGVTTPEETFGNHAVVLPHLEFILRNSISKNKKKANDKETLAFHILTMPMVEALH